MTPSLTTVQQKILQAITAGVATNGYPPTVQELCEISGLRSKSSVHHQLMMLEMKGYIRREFGRSRAITVLQEAA